MNQQNQHFIPQFLLRNFIDADGRVFCLNKQTDVITKPPPKYTGARLGFNELSIRGQIVSFEERFQKIESRAALVFRKIITTNSLTNLRDEERGFVSDFLAAQSFRTDAFRQGLADIDEQKMGVIFERLWDSAFIISKKIKGRKWLLMKIEHDDSFYLGDQPVVLQDTENPKKAQSLGFDIQGIEALFPLTPKLALYMPCLSTSKKIIEAYEISSAFSLHINSLKLSGQKTPSELVEHVEATKRALLSGRGFYEAAIKGVPLVCTPENVENLNYLQCAWAHKNVFSHRKNFTFARRVFTKTPQYRETMQTSLAELSNAFMLIKEDR